MSSTYVVKHYLESYLKGREKALEEISSRPHVVPLQLDLLELTLGDSIDTELISLKDFRDKIADYVLRRHTKYRFEVRKGKLYSGIELVTSQNVKKLTPAVIIRGNEIVGVMYASKDSYASTYRGLFNTFLNKEMKQYLKSTKGKYSHEDKFNVGHLNLTTSEGTLADAPAQYQAYGLLNAIRDTGDIRLSEILEQVETVVTQFEIEHQYPAAIMATFDKSFQSALLSVNANVVIIQQGQQNKLWGESENKLLRQVRGVISSLKFSRSLIEEISYRLAVAFGKEKPANTKTKKTVTASSNKTKTIHPTVQPTKRPVLSTPASVSAPEHVNLSALQGLLNRYLVHVVSANMGDGNEKKILNYRTGRLAGSARVERMSQSREGMITAFYTYMKNPYATFSEGGRQQYPRSRDPKLLISKSIREIAATKKAITRMRAVLV